MIKVEVIEEFTLKKFKELKNIVRNNPNRTEEGRLYVKDTFECTEEMVEYLTKTNAEGRAFVKVIAEEVKEEKSKETKKKATTKKITKK